MKVQEPSGLPNHLRNQQTRGFSQLISALKEPPKHLSDMYDINSSDPVFGNMCGEISGRTTVFFSESNNVTLTVHLSPRLSQPLNIILIYKFLHKTTSDLEHNQEAPYYLGTKKINTYCDRKFVNCDKKKCLIRSPNFPGFYLRNITCNFWVRQDSVPPGKMAQIVLFQSNDYKISIYTGKSSTGAYPITTLTTDCASDVIRVFDGPNANAPLLTEFCGAGTLAELVSSGPEILVQLYSAPEQILHSSMMELEVKVRFVDQSEYTAGRRCHFLISSASIRQGLIYTPRHTLPPNTTCTFHLLAESPTEKVWLYFLSYFVEDTRQWASKESCESGKLEIDDTYGNTTGDAAYRFCEKTYPRICARAADHPDSTPVRPCSYPAESYLSSGPELIIRQDVARSSDVALSSSNFLARFEFVDTNQLGTPVNGTFCDRKIESLFLKKGTIHSPKNIFLFGRGGRENITCSYHFAGHFGERVKLEFTKLKLKSLYCANYYNHTLQRHLCKIEAQTRLATLHVIEYWGDISTAISCFCNMDKMNNSGLFIETVSTNVKLVFSVNEMTPYEDFTDYFFEANYEFVQSNICNQEYQQKNTFSEREISFSVPTWVTKSTVPLRCRWLLEASPQKYLYLKFKGLEPVEVVCLNEGPRSAELDVFSSSWHNETALRRRPRRDYVFVELIASVPGRFSFRWLEVGKPFLRTQSGHTLRNVNCLHECPELNACITPELWCNGHVDCPSGYDESPSHCRQLPLLYWGTGRGRQFWVVWHWQDWWAGGDVAAGGAS
ncbi:hypothetical protein LAZ67_5003895 [Cordylochernes scorpioides]|uniref:CUB domain-containing protein n=1 Tax=Cordylochernes scorpioides TaxID=51811 RepID=A0ABY6KKJ7_9ARAC|nr:hypothetical protein LAZ67_5003895 [Cordylochernes scorpioides]